MYRKQIKKGTLFDLAKKNPKTTRFLRKKTLILYLENV